jgi:small GTP-binding protein
MSDESENLPRKEFTFKIALIGDEGCGKTSLVNKYVQEKFDSDYKPTLGVSILTTTVPLDSPPVNINLVIWDIAGQAKYQTIRQMYFQGCAGVIFVYDATREPTFENIREKWLKDFKQFSLPQSQYILVGNKIDLTDKIKITSDQGQDLASEINAIHFIETSAKTGENVTEMFEILVRKVLEIYQSLQAEFESDGN